MPAFTRGTREEQFRNLSPGLQNFYRMDSPRKAMLMAMRGGMAGVVIATQDNQDLLGGQGELLYR